MTDLESVITTVTVIFYVVTGIIFWLIILSFLRADTHSDLRRLREEVSRLRDELIDTRSTLREENLEGERRLGDEIRETRALQRR